MKTTKIYDINNRFQSVDIQVSGSEIHAVPTDNFGRECDRSGAASRCFNQTEDGAEMRERPVFLPVAKQGYCLRCWQTVERNDVLVTSYRNGRPATVGTCEVCDAEVWRAGGPVLPVVVVHVHAAHTAERHAFCGDPELISPQMSEHDGLDEVRRVCKVLEDLDATVSDHCGRG